MIIGALCAALLLFVLAAVLLLAPTRAQQGWRDDTDCSGIVLHTVRSLGPAERLMAWQQRYWLFHALGDKLAPRLPLQAKHSTVLPNGRRPPHHGRPQ